MNSLLIVSLIQRMVSYKRRAYLNEDAGMRIALLLPR
jgi:hypothetical protein